MAPGMNLKAWVFPCKQNETEVLGLDLKSNPVAKTLSGG